MSRVYLLLRSRLVNCEYEPGKPLAVGDIAGSCGASPIPVREALIRLSEEGLVDHVPYRGFFCPRPSTDRLLHDYEFIRISLQAAGAQIARGIAARQICLRDIELVVSQGMDCRGTDSGSVLAADLERFYRHLARLAGNPNLVKAFDAVVARTHYFRVVDLETRNPIDGFWQHRRAFVEGLKIGDAARIDAVLDESFRDLQSRFALSFQEMAVRLQDRFAARPLL